MWKAIVSGTAGTAHPDSRRPQVIDLCAPEETRSNQGGIPATVFQGEIVRHPRHRTQIKKITGQEMKGCEGNCQTAVFIWLISFLNSKFLTYTFSPWIPDPLPILLPPYKKARLKGNIRWSVRAHTRCLLRSPAIWIKRPWRLNPCLCWLGLVATGSMNSSFSGYSYWPKVC